MGDVFANSREVSGKATPNKSIAAFPSVCLSPPSPPAGPIPIPYPVTSMSSDTNDGTGSVIIKKKEVGHKNGSVYKKCNGNQPATKSFGMDVLSHTLEGKTKFAAYSFDVMFEKDGAERLMDMTTGNHMNPGGAPMFSAAKPGPAAPPSDLDCAALADRNKAFREDNDDTVIKTRRDGTDVTFGESGTVTSGVFRSGANGPVALTGVSASSQLAGCGQNLAPPTSAVHSARPPIDRKTGLPKLKTDGSPYGDVARSYEMGVCPDDKCVHPAGGLQAHAELNILNSIPQPSTPADKLLLNISWNHGGKRNDPRPCTNCKKTLACACKCVTVIICDEEGEPVDRCAKPYEDPPKKTRKRKKRNPSRPRKSAKT